MMFKINRDIKFSKFYKKMNIISFILILLSITVLFIKGLNLGVDFKGGTLIEIRTENNEIHISELRQSLLKMNLGDVTVKNFGKANDYLVKIEINKSNDPSFIESIKNKLSSDLGSVVNFRRVENVGPKVSAELLKSGIIAIGLSLAAMLIYIWIRFEWQFSIGAILALFHDVLLTLGIFSLFSLEINLSIVAAVLTIVGYSMNDTVVIYDRIRESMRKYKQITFDEVINLALNGTLSRTLMTSLTTLLALIALFTFGGIVISSFIIALIWGVLIGTYSSIYVASPILTYLKQDNRQIQN